MTLPTPNPVHQRTLAQLKQGEHAHIAQLHHPHLPAAVRLAELGFVAGAALRVLATAPFGRDPMAVRIGSSTFALRHHEAALVALADAPAL
jgi:ferrous iron transport protein A